jgi:hypothetical protein
MQQSSSCGKSSDANIPVGDVDITLEVSPTARKTRNRGKNKGRVYAKITLAEIIRSPAMNLGFPNLSEKIPQIISKKHAKREYRSQSSSVNDRNSTKAKNRGTTLSSSKIILKKKTTKYRKESKRPFLPSPNLPRAQTSNYWISLLVRLDM